MFVISGLVMSVISLQFWFVTKHWEANGIESLILALISLGITYVWLPESPRFLYSK